MPTKLLHTRGVYGGSPQTIRHRGFVNFQVVLKWIRDHFKNPKKIFVSGSSAGSYGAIMGFPYIKESFPRSKVYVLDDAGNGVTTDSFQQDAIENWNIQIPEWIPGFEDGSEPDMTIDFVYRRIAQYCRFSKLSQFTTAWDWNQTFYYNRMVGDNIDNPAARETGWPSAWPAWNDQMLDCVASAAEMPNYRYYIAAGDYHTIMMSPDFYLKRSAGLPFFMWVKAMVRNPLGFWGTPGRSLEKPRVHRLRRSCALIKASDSRKRRTGKIDHTGNKGGIVHGAAKRIRL